MTKLTELISETDKLVEFNTHVLMTREQYYALRAAALAGEKLSEAVSEAMLIPEHGEARQRVNFALAEYRKSVEQAYALRTAE